MSEKPSFWTTLPGLLTGLAALMTAAGGVLVALAQTGMLARRQPGPPTTSSAAVALDSARPVPPTAWLADSSTTAGDRLRPVSTPAHEATARPGSAGSGRAGRAVSGAAGQPRRIATDSSEQSSGPARAPTTDLRDLQVLNSLPDEVALTIAYTYAGDIGESTLALQGMPFQSDGSPLPGLLLRSVRIKPGTSRAKFSVAADVGDHRYATTSMRVCMRASDRRLKSYCEDFPLHRTWTQSGARPVPPGNLIRSMKARDVSPSQLTIYVDYGYTGDHGLGGRSVHMAATALQRDGSPVPGTHLDYYGSGEVRVGYGHSTIRIVSSQSGAYVSTDVKVCLVSSQPGGEFLCRTFPWAREWR